jgi:glutathione S-transferase
MSSLETIHPRPKITLWLWPTGLFPRRVVYYLRAKNITLSMLQAQNIHLIPVILVKDPPKPGLVSKAGFEPRPSEMSLPALRIQHTDGKEFWIHETSAILEYFEEVFSKARGYEDLRGNTAEQRARTRDALSLLVEASIWGGVALVHSDANTTYWSGLSEGEMSASAAKHAERKFHSLLSRLEKWVEADVVGGESQSLSGLGGSVTLADLLVMAQVEYMQEMYGLDWVGEHGVLRVWYERMKGEEWVVGKEDLLDVENTGEWAGILGA